MNQEMYEKMKLKIQQTCDQELAALEVLAPHFGVFNPIAPLKLVKTPSQASQKPQMKVLKEIPVSVIPTLPSLNKASTGYITKLLPCEIKDCVRNTKPDNKCPSCSKRVCTRHLRGKVCKECSSHGEK